MRVLTQGPLPHRTGRAILAVFCGYFLVHGVTGLVMFALKMGFTYQGVVRYYLGDPDRFLNPRSFAGLLEVTHFHLFAYGFFFVVFTHLLLFTRLPQKTAGVLVAALAGSLTADLAAGWLIRYLHPSFAWLKLGAFWSLQAVSLALLVGLLWGLLGNRRVRAESGSPGLEGDEKACAYHGAKVATR